MDFLTKNKGSDEHTSKPSPLPALGGASAENLQFVDYLIYEPVRTVLLHREGVSVLVPAPERYAVHKLIVASRRLADALGRAKTRQGEILTNVYEEAWERGSSWQEAIRQGIAMLPKAGMRRCAIALENCHDRQQASEPIRP